MDDFDYDRDAPTEAGTASAAACIAAMRHLDEHPDATRASLQGVIDAALAEHGFRLHPNAWIPERPNPEQPAREALVSAAVAATLHLIQFQPSDELWPGDDDQ